MEERLEERAPFQPTVACMKGLVLSLAASFCAILTCEGA